MDQVIQRTAPKPVLLTWDLVTPKFWVCFVNYMGHSHYQSIICCPVSYCVYINIFMTKHFEDKVPEFIFLLYLPWYPAEWDAQS